MGASAGHHHQWGAIAGTTASGAATGAAVGAAFTPIGAAIGAGVGAVGGFLTGLFTTDAADDQAPSEAPPPPPDLADAISKRAELAKQQRLMAGGTGNFLTGPLGDTTTSTARAPRLGGP